SCPVTPVTNATFVMYRSLLEFGLSVSLDDNPHQFIVIGNRIATLPIFVMPSGSMTEAVQRPGDPLSKD
ncbi:MAG: hypothetical protein ABSD59_13000, partial [Terracidiphilus sp.]